MHYNAHTLAPNVLGRAYTEDLRCFSASSISDWHRPVFVRQETEGHKIESEVGFCVDTGSFSLNQLGHGGSESEAFDLSRDLL